MHSEQRITIQQGKRSFSTNLWNATLTVAFAEVGGYFENLEGHITEWLFGAAPPHEKEGLPNFKTPRFTRTISQWLNLLIDTGFHLERIEEPRPSDQKVLECPDIQDAQVVAYYLHIRVRKP